MLPRGVLDQMQVVGTRGTFPEKEAFGVVDVWLVLVAERLQQRAVVIQWRERFDREQQVDDGLGRQPRHGRAADVFQLDDLVVHYGTDGSGLALESLRPLRIIVHDRERFVGVKFSHAVLPSKRNMRMPS